MVYDTTPATSLALSIQLTFHHPWLGMQIDFNNFSTFNLIFKTLNIVHIPKILCIAHLVNGNDFISYHFILFYYFYFCSTQLNRLEKVFNLYVSAISDWGNDSQTQLLLFLLFNLVIGMPASDCLVYLENSKKKFDLTRCGLNSLRQAKVGKSIFLEIREKPTPWQSPQK